MEQCTKGACFESEEESVRYNEVYIHMYQVTKKQEEVSEKKIMCTVTVYILSLVWSVLFP